jgi:hypothetical protein
MRTKHLVIFLVLLLLLANPVNAAVITSGFDFDDEGWTGIPGEGSVAFAASGGNPGGHIRVTDIGIGGLFGSGAIAPNKFLGDLSAFNNGTLSTDLATFAGGGPTFSTFGIVRISGAGDEALFDLATTAPAPGTWQSYSTPLSADAWGKTPLEWTAILADVTEVLIATDAFDGLDTIGVDNFALTPVPLPAAAWLLGSGLVCLLALRKRFLH